MVKTLTTSCTTVFRALYLTRKKCRSHEEQLKSAVFPVPKSFSPVAGMLLMWHFLLSCSWARSRAQGFARRSRDGADSSPRGLSPPTAGGKWSLGQKWGTQPQPPSSRLENRSAVFFILPELVFLNYQCHHSVWNLFLAKITRYNQQVSLAARLRDTPHVQGNAQK